jgi:hypothetical protein
MLGVELFDQRLHAHAVAAAEEVPPDDGFLGLCSANGQQRDRGQHCDLE